MHHCETNLVLLTTAFSRGIRSGRIIAFQFTLRTCLAFVCHMTTNMATWNAILRINTCTIFSIRDKLFLYLLRIEYVMANYIRNYWRKCFKPTIRGTQQDDLANKLPRTIVM